VRQLLDERRPSTPTGRRARIYYVTQTDVAPPTIVLFVNNPDFVDTTYQRFMINRFRELLPYPEVPIKLHVRQRVRHAEGAKEMEDADEQPPAGKSVAPKGVRRTKTQD
jgi:GTP-binding protein